MTTTQPNISKAAWEILGQARLPVGGEAVCAGTALHLDNAFALAAEIRTALNDEPSKVFATFSPERGDYVRRVEHRGSICCNCQRPLVPQTDLSLRLFPDRRRHLASWCARTTSARRLCGWISSR